jgi:MFS family permease
VGIDATARQQRRGPDHRGAAGDASASNGDPETVGIVGGSLLFVVLCLAYLAGGYVAGRMSRFDGARQGLGMWMFGLVIAGLLAVIGLLAGSADYNPLAQLDLPRIPVEEGALTSGGQIAMAAIVIGTFLAAIGGGIIGERYHRRVDEAGFEPATPKLSGRPKPAPPKAPAEAPLAR